MLDHYGEWYKHMNTMPPLLFMVGEQRRDIIPRTLMDPQLPENRRIHVNELVVYGTGVMETFEEDFKRILMQTKHKGMRWVVVFSPTGCEAMLRALHLLDPQTGKAKTYAQRGDTYIATIGPTTRDFLRETFGFEADVCAEKPNPESIHAGIMDFLQSR